MEQKPLPSLVEGSKIPLRSIFSKCPDRPELWADNVTIVTQILAKQVARNIMSLRKWVQRPVRPVEKQAKNERQVVEFQSKYISVYWSHQRLVTGHTSVVSL